MITRKMIFDGYYKGIVRLIESPNEDGVVCQIGDNWFYFGGLTAEECKTVEEYKASVDTKTILDEIYSVLNDFKDSGEEYQDEYSYYELYLKEKGIKEMKTVKELTREELNELKSNYFYSHLDNDNSNQCDGYDAPWDIPDEIIFEHYEGITFTDDDFFCTANNKEEESMDWKEKFYEKLNKELEAFRNSYNSMEVIQIYNDYYIIGFYEAIHEILSSDYVEDNYEEILIWLSEKEKPLEFLYEQWMDVDGSFSFGWDENIHWINDLYRKETNNG